MMSKSIVLVIFIMLKFSNHEVIGFSDKLSGESIIYGIASMTGNYEDRSSKCWKDLHTLFEGVEERHVWALKAIDASGKPQTGFLHGNNLWVGSHAMCSELSNRKPLEINHEKIKRPEPTEFDYPPYPMKFIKVFLKHNDTLQMHVRFPFDFTIQVGLCVPESCTDTDISEVFKIYLTENYLNIQQITGVHMEVESVRTLQEDISFMLSKPKFILLCSVIGIVLFLSIVGTFYDLHMQKRERKLVISFRQNLGDTHGKSVSEIELVKISRETVHSEESGIMEIIRCFSLNSNIKALVNTKLSSDSITCIHGLRFFGMFWVCIIHSMFFQADYIVDPPQAFRLSETLPMQLFSNSTYSVDTYLFISGFLLGYLYLKSKKRDDNGSPVNYGRKISEFFMMCFNRFARLTPPYLVTILMCDVAYTYQRAASVLESYEAPDLLCPKYWWRNLLYINNLFPRTEMCLSWSWYLSLDTQAFIISAILLIVSTFAFRTAAFTLVSFILGCMVITGYKSYTIHYIPTMDEQLEQLDAIYDFPWNRMGPYLIGVITAYLLVEKLQSKLSLGKTTRILCWIVFPMLNIWILFTLYTRQISVEFSAVYMGISRTLWGVGIAWILVACCTGYADSVNSFLSFSGWVPLARLTYCAYLLNPLVANWLYLGSETPFYSTRFGFILSIGGVTLCTFLSAFFMSIFFESPFILLTKILMRIFTKTPRTKSRETSIGSDKS